MERHAEIVRQWRILLALEGRARGQTLAALREAAGDAVSERTIRRDLEALAQAGFPIESQRRDGRAVFSLNREVFAGLAATGLSLPELCALYLSRTVLAALAGGPFHAHLTSAFDKLIEALPPALWRFVEQLPTALEAKAPALRGRASTPRVVDALLGAVLGHRRVRMRYHSFASRQVKEYGVEPYRVAYAQGTLYLFAFVPEYGEMRTFAVHRIEELVVLDDRFDPRDAGGSAFPDSVSAFTGPARRVVVEVAAEQAPYVRERDWHPSQRVDDLPDGGVCLTLDVTIDWGLEAWILGFGAAARVRAPQDLADRIAARLKAALAHYEPAR